MENRKKKLFLGIILALMIVAIFIWGIKLYSIRKMIGTTARNESQSQKNQGINGQASGSDIMTNSETESEGPSFEGESTIPDNFPKNVFIVDGAKIHTATSNDSGYSLTYTTAASSDKVLSGYQTEMMKLGWEKGEEADLGKETGQMITFSRSDQGIMIIVGTLGSETSVSINGAFDKNDDPNAPVPE